MIRFHRYEGKTGPIAPLPASLRYTKTEYPAASAMPVRGRRRAIDSQPHRGRRAGRGRVGDDSEGCAGEHPRGKRAPLAPRTTVSPRILQAPARGTRLPRGSHGSWKESAAARRSFRLLRPASRFLTTNTARWRDFQTVCGFSELGWPLKSEAPPVSCLRCRQGAGSGGPRLQGDPANCACWTRRYCRQRAGRCLHG